MKIPQSIARIVFAKKDRIKKLALKEEHEDKKEIERRQWDKFKALIEHAYANVEFYTKKFDDAKITPDDIKTRDDLKKIPFTTKEELKECFPDKTRAKNLPENRFFYKRTSGSTQEPFGFYLDTQCIPEERKSLFRMHNAMGLKFQDTIIRLRSTPIKRNGIKGLLQKIFGNTKFIGTMDMSYDNMDKYVNFIKANPPVMIESFPHHILALARYMDSKEITLDARIIHLVGGNINEREHALLTRLFGAKIYNDYGSAECMRVAYQCEKANKYHVEMDRYLLEVINKGKPAKTGEMGEMIITDLYNYTMPFIRYRIKDIAIPGKPCSCNRGYPVLDRIVGRVRQVIFLPNGRLLDPNNITRRMVYFFEEIEGWQTVYTKDNILEIQVVPTENFTKDTEKKIIDKLDEFIQGVVPIKVIKKKQIDRYGHERKKMTTLTQIPPDLTLLE